MQIIPIPMYYCYTWAILQLSTDRYKQNHFFANFRLCCMKVAIRSAIRSGIAKNSLSWKFTRFLLCSSGAYPKHHLLCNKANQQRQKYHSFVFRHPNHYQPFPSGGLILHILVG